MKILLIQPRARAAYRAFLPLGLAYVAASLISQGHEVSTWEGNEPSADMEETRRYIQKHAGEFDLVGITALASDYLEAEWIANTLRAVHPALKIVLGGHLPSSLPGFLMKRMPVDFVVVGEGEATAAELATAISTGGSFEEIRGLYFRNGSGDIIATPPRPRMAKLDKLPVPPWHLFPMETYLSSGGTPNLGYFDRTYQGEMSIMASRGCPCRCCYCDPTVKGRRPRYRPVAHVLDEIRQAVERFGDRIKIFYFWDDILIWDRDWTEQFCNALIREKIRISWTCNCHVNHVNARLMDLMHRAGCEDVRFGLESGSQRILDALKKDVTVENALKALRVCINAGLALTLYNMVGGPGESEETIDETIAFYDELIQPSTVYKVSRIYVSILTPFPGTRLFERVQQEGRVDNLDGYLRKGLDAQSTLSLNLSACADEELIELKEKLQTGIARIREDRIFLLKNILSEMRQAARR